MNLNSPYKKILLVLRTKLKFLRTISKGLGVKEFKFLNFENKKKIIYIKAGARALPPA